MCLILYAAALGCFVLAYVTFGTPGFYIVLTIGSIIGILAPAFHYLTVEDEGDALGIRFGPVPLFRTRARYDDIQSVEVGRTLLLDGWGIHYSLRGGWVWNLWGFDCVVVRKKKGTLYIGTNDADNLARFLEEKLAESCGKTH
jgi:hypothetical protein